MGSFTVTNPSQSPMALPEAQAVEPQPYSRKGDETTSEGFPSLAFRSLLLTRALLPMVPTGEKAFNRRHRLFWIRQLSVEPAPSPPPPS